MTDMRHTPLYYYNPRIVAQKENFHLAGIERFSAFFDQYFGPTTVFIDRTETIKIPLRVKSIFPIPKFRFMKKTFEEICNERARELLDRADALDAALHVFYSGGIDSTLVLISLLKNASAQQRENLKVLLSEESIRENPLFYQDHIRGKLRVDSANMFPYLLGEKCLFVGGEYNDQIFGSNLTGSLIDGFGSSVIHQPYNRDILFAFFNHKINNAKLTHFYLDLFDRLRLVAPIDIATNQEYLWWINFTLKWQSVFFRMLCYVTPRNAPNIDEHYISTYFNHFYGTDEFQLWSLNNPDKKIRNTWKSYKWVCKDIIYEYTKDADYRDNKVKRDSLAFVLTQQQSFNFIDSSMKFWNTLELKDYHNVENDFA